MNHAFSGSEEDRRRTLKRRELQEAGMLMLELEAGQLARVVPSPVGGTEGVAQNTGMTHTVVAKSHQSSTRDSVFLLS